MPYGLRKSPRKEMYWVYNKETGRKYSKRPLSLEMAKRQRRAIYASENGYSLRRSRIKAGSAGIKAGIEAGSQGSPCLNLSYGDRPRNIGTLYSHHMKDLLQLTIDDAYGELEKYNKQYPAIERTPEIERGLNMIKCYIEEAKQKIAEFDEFVKERHSKGLRVGGGRRRH